MKTRKYGNACELEPVKHTTAPWSFRPANGKDYSAGARVFTLATPHGQGMAHIYSVENTEANARLIAAAPELLEACRLAERHTLPTPVLIALRNAIGKAGGAL
jgi:hypothetical protein